MEPRGQRVLAVTGDDFGLTPGVNAGIVDAHRNGVLTHASLMSGAPFVREALAMARATPTLAVGVHLTLVDGAPVLPASRVPSLVGPDRRFRRTSGDFVADWVLLRVDPADVEREFRAQIRVLIDAGFQPTHLDSHKHTHMWPPVFEIVAKLAREYGIERVRSSFERPALRTLLAHAGQPDVRGQAVDNLLMAPLWAMTQVARRRAGLSDAWFLGRVHTGHLSVDRLARAIRQAPAGYLELMTHPGYVDAHLEQVRTRLRAEREAELRLLQDPAVRDLLDREQVRLASLAGNQREVPPAVAPGEWRPTEA